LRRRVFKTRTFARWSRKAGLPDQTLCAAVDEISGGLVATRLGERWFFLYGFAKNERATIDDHELAVLQMTAEALLEMDHRSLGGAIQAGELAEICDEEEPHTG
jgi:hypothetical protein